MLAKGLPSYGIESNIEIVQDILGRKIALEIICKAIGAIELNNWQLRHSVGVLTLGY
jgi:hypothetical protein